MGGVGAGVGARVGAQVSSLRSSTGTPSSVLSFLVLMPFNLCTAESALALSSAMMMSISESSCGASMPSCSKLVVTLPVVETVGTTVGAEVVALPVLWVVGLAELFTAALGVPVLRAVGAAEEVGADVGVRVGEPVGTEHTHCCFAEQEAAGQDVYTAVNPS